MAVLTLKKSLEICKRKNILKKIFSIESKSICKLRPGLQMDVKADEAEDEFDVDVVVGCDMPMSIYLKPIIVITFCK